MMDNYALRYSNYEGGVSIGSYMAHWAEVKGMEYVAMHAFVPMYDFSQLAPDLQGITVENDFGRPHVQYGVQGRADLVRPFGKTGRGDAGRASYRLRNDLTYFFPSSRDTESNLALRYNMVHELVIPLVDEQNQPLGLISLDAPTNGRKPEPATYAALAGVNSVSGPGMLDFLLVFSLPKLVLDDELCGQALRYVREIRPVDDLPARALVDQVLADQHLIMAEHTTRHWPEELYLPSPIVDRDNREAWTRQGAKDAYRRAIDEVGRRLAAYHQLETDPAIDAELRRIIRSGLVDQTELPQIPVAPEPVMAASGPGAGGRRHNRRRERIGGDGEGGTKS